MRGRLRADGRTADADLRPRSDHRNIRWQWSARDDESAWTISVSTSGRQPRVGRIDPDYRDGWRDHDRAQARDRGRRAAARDEAGSRDLAGDAGERQSAFDPRRRHVEPKAKGVSRNVARA